MFSELADEHKLKKLGNKFELIGRLLSLFPPEKLTAEALNEFKLTDLKGMAKGVDLPQVGSKAQLVASLVAHATANAIPDASAPSTPQPKKRARSESVDKAPKTEKRP